MVLRFLMKYLANNEQLINKLADSKPIRRAAQFVVYIVHKTRTNEIPTNPSGIFGHLRSLAQRLKTNFKQELEQAKEELKKKQQ